MTFEEQLRILVYCEDQLKFKLLAHKRPIKSVFGYRVEKEYRYVETIDWRSSKSYGTAAAYVLQHMYHKSRIYGIFEKKN